LTVVLLWSLFSTSWESPSMNFTEQKFFIVSFLQTPSIWQKECFRYLSNFTKSFTFRLLIFPPMICLWEFLLVEEFQVRETTSSDSEEFSPRQNWFISPSNLRAFWLFCGYTNWIIWFCCWIRPSLKYLRISLFLFLEDSLPKKFFPQKCHSKNKREG